MKKENRGRVLKKVGKILVLACIMTLIFSVAVFADGEEAITTSIKNALDYWRGQVAAVAGSAAGICIVVCGIVAIFSHDDKVVHGLWKWGKRIILCLIIIAAAPTIVSSVYDWATKSFEQNEKITKDESNEVIDFDTVTVYL